MRKKGLRDELSRTDTPIQALLADLDAKPSRLAELGAAIRILNRICEGRIDQLLLTNIAVCREIIDIQSKIKQSIGQPKLTKTGS